MTETQSKLTAWIFLIAGLVMAFMERYEVAATYTIGAGIILAIHAAADRLDKRP